MKHLFLLSGTLGLLCLGVLSCSQEIESGDPFADAKWIGTSWALRTARTNRLSAWNWIGRKNA